MMHQRKPLQGHAVSGYQIAYIACNEDLSITEASPHAAELLDLPAHDIEGAKLTAVCLPLLGSEPQLGAVLDGTLPHLALEQINLQTPEGDTRYVSLMILPYALMASHQPGLIVLLNDVSEQSTQQQRLQQQHGELLLLHEKVAEQNQQLAQFNQKLSKLSQLRSDMLTILSQDMQSSLKAILDYSTLLLDTDTTTLSNDQYQNIVAIQHHGKTLFNLVENLIALQRLDSSELPYRDSINVNHLVQRVIYSLREQTRKADSCILYGDFPADAIEPDLNIIGDNDLLQQALTNLLSYSIVSAGMDATIHISLTLLTTLPALDPLLDPGRTWCTLEIADDGPGETLQPIEHIFDASTHSSATFPLTQSERSFGLVIVQKVIQQHAGRVTVQNRPGDGTTFTIFLPCTLQP